MDQKTLINVLKQEIEESTGCTDPGAVALAAAKSVQVLGNLPERVEIEVSPNVYKNGVSVGIPGTDRRGLDHAAALGVYLPERVEDNLGLLNHADQEVAEKARRFLLEERISLHRAEEGVDPLYAKATAHGSGCQAWAIIEGDYSNIVEWARDGRRLFEKPRKKADSQSNPLNAFPLVDIVQMIQGMDKAPLWFLMDAAFTNKKAAMLGISNGTSRLGAFYHRLSHLQHLQR